MTEEKGLYTKGKESLEAEAKGQTEPVVSPSMVREALSKLEAENARRKADLNEITVLLKAAIQKDIETKELEKQTLELTNQWLRKKIWE